MANQPNQPVVINKSGTTQMKDSIAHRNDNRPGGEGEAPRRRRPNFRRGDNEFANVPKEFETITISIDRVARVVSGGRRFRFKALVAMGNGKNKIGVGVAKGADVTAAVTKAEARAKKNMIEIPIEHDTISHEVEVKLSGARVLMKPAAPGTGIVAGGVVRSIIGLTGIKNLLSKSLGSTNKVNIAYAVIEGLKQQVPRSEWKGAKAKKAEAEEESK